MIKTELNADTKFLEMINSVRKEVAGDEAFDKDRSWQANVMIDPHFLEDQGYIYHIIRRLIEHERDAIYRAVVNSSEEWTTIRTRFLAKNTCDIFDRRQLAVRVDASIADKKVYIPIFEHQSMPRDVFKCSWCGGYTKNDKRGHCAGCGGPRNDDYIKEVMGEL